MCWDVDSLFGITVDKNSNSVCANYSTRYLLLPPYLCTESVVFCA